jgi:excisionase family DNA binding protein
MTLPRLTYSAREVAEMTSLSEAHVLRMAKSGRLAAIREGRRWLILDSGIR